VESITGDNRRYVCQKRRRKFISVERANGIVSLRSTRWSRHV